MNGRHGSQRANIVAMLTPARTVVGTLHLLFPGALASVLLGRELSPGERRVIRVLGVRQITQAVASGRVPSPAVVSIGTEVDLVHAASLIGLAIHDRSHRRIAIVGASIAGGFAFAGAAASRVSASDGAYPPSVVTPTTSDSFANLREQWADRLARFVVPGYARANGQPRRHLVEKG